MTVQIDEGTTYTLPDYFADGDASATDNCTDPIILTTQIPAPGTELGAGTYTIDFTATDESGNLSSCSFELVVEELLSTNDVSLSDNIVIYPNPTTGGVTLLNNSNAVIQSINITDVNGRLIQSLDVFENQQQILFTLQDFATGIYFVNIATEQSNIIKRIVKK
ncbi:MAG: T9SS type A sorting domain-containing protein [Flavobacteriaceae bacterium]|nr:T9SS type A sorting domain-containing protein [Flavobacteriaceae bacterium]